MIKQDYSLDDKVYLPEIYTKENQKEYTVVKIIGKESYYLENEGHCSLWFTNMSSILIPVFFKKEVND